jgi:tetratricopeptide (TPR) repeat protein
MHNRLNEAIAAFKQALTIKPDYAETHYNLAYGYLNKGHNPYLAADHFYKAGLTHLEQGRLDKAFEAYKVLTQIKSEELAQELYEKLSLKLKQEKGYPEKTVLIEK